jgi:TrmH family RNA methyltransferase
MPALAVEVVLVRPSRPRNVAAAARAMKNMGLGGLRIVSPPPGLAGPDARALAYGAWDVLDAAAFPESLAAAVADATLVVAASGRDDPRAWTPRELASRAALRAGSGRLALVFGPEASGLSDAELGLCHEVVRIPSAAAQPSLNLAQAVLILAYELYLGAMPAHQRAPEHAAPAARLEDALAALRESLLAIGYLDPQNPEAILAELRRLLSRAGATERELTLVRGMARQIAWAGRQPRP